MSKVVKSQRWLELLLLLSIPAIAPDAAAQQMMAPIRQVKYEDAFRAGFSLPRWEQGHLVSWKYDTSATSTDENLAVFDRDGKLVGKTRVWLQGASLLRIEDATAREDGQAAVVGWVISSSGNVAAFLADVSLTHGTGKVIQTSPFEGQAVGFGPDGSIWVLGLVVGPERGKGPAPDHYMVQHFGTDGILRAQHLLRSDFSCELGLEFKGIARVTASGDRIGIFSPSCRTWVELSPSGELMGQWKWNPVSPVSSRGVETAGILTITLTSTNELYGWREGVERGLYRFDRHASAWIPVHTGTAQNAGTPPLSLEGSDGDTIVYHASEKRLAWFKP